MQGLSVRKTCDNSALEKGGPPEEQKRAGDPTGRGLKRKGAQLAGRLWVKQLRQDEGSVTGEEGKARGGRASGWVWPRGCGLEGRLSGLCLQLVLDTRIVGGRRLRVGVTHLDAWGREFRL